MRRGILFTCLLLLPLKGWAATDCSLLFDVNHHKLVAQHNPQQCAKRLSPNSTFKVALSLMAFDRHLITQQTQFHWDHKKRFLAQWNHDQTPQTWLRRSVIWVSRVLTPKLGMAHISRTLQQFHYGNADFSGGLGEAWLDNSLKISANEQLAFLQAMLAETLPVEAQAIHNTEQNLYRETLPNGWKLYGKTGSGNGQGWFVGYVEKEQHRFIFVVNMLGTVKYSGGKQAENQAKKLLMKSLGVNHAHNRL